MEYDLAIVVMKFILSCLQLTIFGCLWYYYFTHSLFKCPCKKYNHGFPIAKSSAILININILLILISVCKIYRKLIYIKEELITAFHRYLGLSLVFWSFVHSIAHYVNFNTNKMEKLLITSGAGLTGNLIMLFIFLIIISVFIKNKSYFYILHNIFSILCIIILCFHGTFCTIKYNINTCPDSQSWKWLLSGIIIIFVEKIYKYSCITYSNSIIKITDNLYQINLKLSNNFCGKLIYINIPTINKFEWHPFITSSYNSYTCTLPTTDGRGTSEVSIHVKGNGDWTNKIIKYLNTKSLIKLKIDGPYYNLPKNFTKNILNEPSVFITSGIGITSFSYILQQISKKSLIISNLYLIIILKTPDDISWFIPTLELLSKQKNIHILFYFTNATLQSQSLVSKVSNTDIYFPFKFNNGRPNFNNLLDTIFINNLFDKPNMFINIYFSGNYSILKELKNITENNKSFRLYHY